jgi:hypothetical protein
MRSSEDLVVDSLLNKGYFYVNFRPGPCIIRDRRVKGLNLWGVLDELDEVNKR